MQTVIVYGGSGFVGSHLIPRLEAQGYTVVVCDRVEPRFAFKGHFVEINILEPLLDQWDEEAKSYLSNPYAVINLAGKSIFGRFTEEHKQAIYDSRVVGTRRVIQTFREPRFKPRVYLAASAVGIYGDQGSQTITEQGSASSTFLASVVVDWEGEARRVEDLDIRLAIFRQGHILGDGGMLAVLKPYYEKGLGGPLGSGKQFFPWIHVEDIVGYYLAALANDQVRGTYNLVVGTPITYREFSRMLARALGKPHLFRIPVWALRMKFGSFAQEMTVSQKIEPQRVRDTGYTPVLGSIDEAIEYEVSQ